MKAHIYLVTSILSLIHSAGATYGQVKSTKAPATISRPETLTNKSIVSLSAAGLPPDIITSKISSSTCAFDLSTNGLLALKQAGVKDEVIAAMMGSTGNKSGRTATVKSNISKATAPKLEMANHPYVRNQPSGAWKPLEKATASMKTKMVAMGYGGMKVLYQIPDEKSTTRLSATDSVSFLINTFGSAVPEFVLYHAKIENGKRTVVGAQVKQIGGASAGQDNLNFNVLSVGDGIFRLVPIKKLLPGEYFFSTKPVSNAATADAYAFGVD